ncbi:hypothetical protein HW130_14820 [Streptomyces sp. PKU-EA00015]|uniref:DUF6223 family protein n=1 Tax=Streptomyces sp. PKU-EA00015 TaxID=2748326 RepID=UPI0015A13A5B|nr:DUF6223 family protein [Streptomyces sp. PKU-EA00015]NWF27521.1 hypothetical protein [Streptomyces sp. PKU-EA00015]
MSVRRLLAAAAAALLGATGLAAPAAAHASVQPVAAGFYDFSLGRLGASTGALLGLAGVVVAGLALARPTGRLGAANGSLRAMVAMAAGLISMALGGLVAATADGGLGTGNGLGGAYVAMLVGLIATLLGGLALRRSRRTG